MRYRIATFLLAVALIFIAKAGAETITVTTYNVEHFAGHFEAQHLTTRKVAKESDDAKEMVDIIRTLNDKQNWATAETILDPKVNPDIIVLQECCNQKDLEYFNKRWLKGAYEFVNVFPSNSERDQFVAMMIKPGFKVLQKDDQYYLEKDTGKNDRGDRLFARGPAFVKIQSPGGYVFWVGTNHMKSKRGNDAEVTAWRNREAVRCHQLMVEHSKAGPSDLIFLGDMNDEYGLDGEFEKNNGGDSIANILGPESDGFVLATKPLLAKGEISFGGYWRSDFRSFIDHVFVSPTLSKKVKDVSVFQDKLAPISSDHYPVTVKIEATPEAPAALRDAMP